MVRINYQSKAQENGFSGTTLIGAEGFGRGGGARTGGGAGGGAGAGLCSCL